MIASYRLQLHPGFTFDDARAQIPYLRALGVSHLYLSPITEARAGSTHGYDVIDHNEVRAELGGREGFERLAAAAHAAGLALLLDFVPNHAGVGPRNAYWQDLLAYGPSASGTAFFDVDWDPIKPELQGKILLPFLGRPYGDVLDDGELTLAYDDGRFYAAYYDQRYALSPATYAQLLAAALPRFERTDAYWELKDLHDAYATVQPGEREKADTLRPRLVQTLATLPLDAVLTALDAPTLHALFERQHWRLSYWQTAGAEINYRRFFDINDLVALRMEDDRVFWDAHRLLGELLALPGVAGVRIDHVDGLFDPHGYLRRLRELGAARVWVEKILAFDEQLPKGWPVEGTTGYLFMNDVQQVLLQPAGQAALDAAYARLVPGAAPYADVVWASKRLVQRTSLNSELQRLAYELDRISEADYHTRDFTLEALRRALESVVAAFGRYRTYLPHTPEAAAPVVDAALAEAQRRDPRGEPTVYAFLRRVLLGAVRADLEPVRRAWVGRFQQYTAPVAAKGVEDTAFYRYARLVALNEVGGEPDVFGLPPEAFHARAAERAERFPRNLLATATHDHKRGEDTRMRLIALAEVPEAWAETAAALDALGREHAPGDAPDAADRYVFFQVLAALWDDASGRPAGRAGLADRLAAYLQKASRERKERTSWVNPDADYEAALDRFVRALVADDRTAAVLDPFGARLARLGFANSLSQSVLKLTSPGVPDLYQGTEELDLSLVNPDNRRPVDYDDRRRRLEALQPLLDAPQKAPWEDWIDQADPTAKLYVLACLLRLRHRHPALFEGAYVPLMPEGPHAEHVLAFARTAEEAALVAVVSRFPASRPSAVEARLDLPEGLRNRRWTEALTGHTLAARRRLPVAELPLPWAVLVAS